MSEHRACPWATAGMRPYQSPRICGMKSTACIPGNPMWTHIAAVHLHHAGVLVGWLRAPLAWLPDLMILQRDLPIYARGLRDVRA